MSVQVLAIPYDSGKRSFRMGRGPEHLLQHGLIDHLRAAGHRAELHEVMIEDPRVPSDIGSAIAIHRELSERVRRASSAGAFPLVLAGNCNSAVGTLAGIGPERTGVIWLDSHGDLNTPETTTSGFLDGMALAMITGRCWSQIARTVVGWTPVADQNVVLLGARELDPPEAELLQESAIIHVPADSVRTQGIGRALGPALDEVGSRVSVFYLHVDLDVIDPEEARANEYAAPNGLSIHAVSEAIQLITDRRPIAAAAFTAYDPALDETSATLHAAFELVDAVLRSVSESDTRSE
jgi:arginase